MRKDWSNYEGYSMNEKGELDLSEFSSLLSNKTKIVFVNHVSNALGTVNPIEIIIEKSHQAGLLFD